jgi:hypothetical protein
MGSKERWHKCRDRDLAMFVHLKLSDLRNLKSLVMMPWEMSMVKNWRRRQ